jgi:outer membrane biosynthesis protein TonB
MSSCGEFEGLIAASLYGPLKPDEEALLSSHLASCAACRREKDELGQTQRLVGTAEPVEVQSDTFLAAVRKKVGQKTHRKLRKPVVRRFAWVLPTGIAAALLLTAIGIFLYTREGPPPPAPHNVVAEKPAPAPVPKPDEVVPPAPPTPAHPPVPAPAPIPAPPMPSPKPPTPEKPPPVEPPAPTPAPAPAPAPAPRETVAVMAQIDAAPRRGGRHDRRGKGPRQAGTRPDPRTGSSHGQPVELRGDQDRRRHPDHARGRYGPDPHERPQGGNRRARSCSPAARCAPSRQAARGRADDLRTAGAEARVLGTELLLFAGAESTRLESAAARSA